MTHLKTLIAEFYDWKGYLVKVNTKVGRLAHGGWEMELDAIPEQFPLLRTLQLSECGYNRVVEL